jgi:WD40 repeat protein
MLLFNTYWPGNLVSWDLVTNTTRKLFLGKYTIFCLALHPDEPEVAAFGCKLGLVLIVSLAGGGRILQKMRGHDEDVYALAWSPSDQTRVS